MANSERPISILPTIKCSTCGVEIDISHLADHVCAPSSAKAVEPPAPKLDRAATFSASRFSSNTSSQARPNRVPPPPRIDPSAANKPFRPQNQLTPMTSFSDPKSLSPLSPIHGRPPFKMNRSATSPMPRAMGPPSPDLPPNMDCAFPPFPPRSATPQSAKPKSKDRLEPSFPHRYAEADPLYAPLSPRTNGGESVLKRMNTIAPGPFDGRGGDSRPGTSSGRKSPAQQEAGFGHRRTATQSSMSSNGKAPNQRTSLASTRSRSSTYSNGSVGLPSRPKLGASTNMPPPPRPPQTEGIDAFLSRLQKETMEPSKIVQDVRSKTFPLRKDSKEATGPPPRPRRPSESNGPVRRGTDMEPFNPSRPNNMFPARSTSRAGSRTALRREDAPPLPTQPAYESNLPPKPLHTPSDSGQSDGSVSSAGFRSVASSQSSPPSSVTSGLSRRPSKAGGRDPLGEERIPRTASPVDMAMGVQTLGPERREQSPGMRRENKPEPLLQPPPMLYADAPESPMDPAIQRGLLYQKRPSDAQGSSQAPPSDLSRSPPKRAPTTAGKRLPTASKGNCRGCSEPIVGKSVKDSSGRLTGRYHKQCFVCRTCRSPFPTADFYVYENSPYCEHHYHELNGSLCKSCDRGIEGQYLETDQQQKFHPKCFTCFVCRVVLRDDYFEVGGKVYCDRHAYHAAQQGSFLGVGGNKSRNLQKRTTRLMMMM